MTAAHADKAAGAPVRRFAALTQHDFRRLWVSSVGVGSGRQMEQLALGWYILETTNSAVLVGLIGAVRWAGMVLAPFFGVLADRVNRRNLLLIIQALALACSAVIFVLAISGALGTRPLFALVLVAGLAGALDNTTRQTLVGDLVNRSELVGAVALIQAAMNGSAVLAPVIAGAVFGVAGLSGCYLLISALTLIALLANAGIRPRPMAVPARHSALRSLIEGAAYVRRDRVVAALLIIAAIANLCGFPVTFAMMPSFARDELGVASVGLGVLLGASGAGALLGNLLLGSLGVRGDRGRAVVLTMLAWMLFLALFAVTPWFVPALLLLALAGATQAVSLALVAALLLDTTPEALRGRVMGVRMFAIATLPLGAAASGPLIERFGAPATALLFAAAGVLMTLFTVVRVPALLRRA